MLLKKIEYKHTNSENEAYLELMKSFDAELRAMYGAHQDGANPLKVFSKAINIALVFYNDALAGCGGYKEHTATTAEVKRVYVLPQFRNKGLGKGIMCQLEEWGVEEGYTNFILVTGNQQHDAIALYKAIGYNEIDKYPPYENNPIIVCFGKRLTAI